jgi:alpha-1,3-fucosyltransferase
VVLGGANYSAIAPPHSFIDANDFPDPKSLAHFLKLVQTSK